MRVHAVTFEKGIGWAPGAGAVADRGGGRIVRAAVSGGQRARLFFAPPCRALKRGLDLQIT
jgi:hypothetical protein